jgi:hypothetical protein
MKQSHSFICAETAYQRRSGGETVSKNSPQKTKKPLTVQEAGHLGGQRVKQLIAQGKALEKQTKP